MKFIARILGPVGLILAFSVTGALAQGTHVFLAGVEVDIHLCPQSFLESKGCHLSESDEVRVTGSKLTLRGSAVLLAKKLHCGEHSIALREDDGRPLWSRARR